MRTKLDAVHHNIADWTLEIDEDMAARAATLAAAEAELDIKIRAAKDKLVAPHDVYQRETTFFKRKVWPFKPTKEKLRRVTQELVYAKEIVVKLEKAKTLIASLQRDDLIRQTEITVQNTKITPLWDALNAKVLAGQDWDTADKNNYKKIAQAQVFIQEIHAQIIKNTQRIEQCHRVATAYDEAHPELFPAHWLNIASVIVEQQDKYGFRGEINHQDLDTTKTPGTGLEGYSTSYGAVLKPGEVVSYTLPGTKILLEQDNSGRVVDKTPHTASMQHKELAAIKTAHLLLLDRTMHPEKKIYLKGSADNLQQIQLLVAALRVTAKQNGIVLELADLSVEVPGWANWRGSTGPNMSEVAQYEVQIDGLMVQRHAQDELKEKVRDIRGQTLVGGEPTHPPRKH